ncbi:MAG: hypothetical protein WCX69_00825 [Candidatus Paceibacterota bacterium]
MRNHNKKFNLLKTAAFSLEKMAHWPLLVFLLFSAIGIGVAAWIFFAFQNSDDSAIQGMSSAKTAMFNKSDEKKYNEVFSIMKQREIDFGQAASATYPNVFEPAQKKPAQ